MPPRSKKTTPKSVPKAALHNQLSSDLVDSIIKSLDIPTNNSAGAPSTLNVSPKKRKNVVVISDNDSSGIDLLETPAPSPKKARAGTPPPGMPEYKNLPAVSFVKTSGNDSPASAELLFGSARPSRTRVLTEKGAYNEDMNARDAPRKGITAKPRGQKKIPVKAATPAPSADGFDGTSPPGLLGSPIALLNAVQDSPTNKHTKNGSNGVPPLFVSKNFKSSLIMKKEPISNDDMPEVSDLMLSSPVKDKSTGPAPISPEKILASMLDVEAKEEKSGSAHSGSDLDHYLATDDDGSSACLSEEEPTANVPDDVLVISVSDNSSNGDDTITPPATVSSDPDNVTSTAYHEPSMSCVYAGLPYLDALREIEPYGGPADSISQMMPSEIARTLNQAQATTMMKALVFTQSGFFVNFSRIDPGVLRNDSNRILMDRADKAPAVGIYTGICTHSVILGSDSTGPPRAPYNVHGVTVAGTEQDSRRFSALIGKVLGYDKIVGHQTKSGLSFYTRGEGKNPNFVSNPTPSAPPPALVGLRSIATRPSSATSSGLSRKGPSQPLRKYPMARWFKEPIPVYDGREGHGRQFNFTDSDFENLATWPLYRKGRKEIEPGTIVSVGHTISTYTGAAGGLFLSTNIHFVIVIGKPAVGLPS